MSKLKDDYLQLDFLYCPKIISKDYCTTPTYRTFNEINAWLQIETKIDESPLDTFPLIFLLKFQKSIFVQ